MGKGEVWERCPMWSKEHCANERGTGPQDFDRPLNSSGFATHLMVEHDWLSAAAWQYIRASRQTAFVPTSSPERAG